MERKRNAEIELVCAVASDQNCSSTRFFVPHEWSGSGSVRGEKLEEDDDKFAVQRVPSITLDSLFADSQMKEASLLFRIDVEGQEASVLEGMKGLLDLSSPFVGIVEFKTDSVDGQGTAAADYIGLLRSRFELYPFGKQGLIQDLDASNWLSNRSITDLILVSDIAIARRLGVIN